MTVRVAVLAAPAGRIGPEHPDFEAFFRLARGLGAVFEPVPVLDDAALAGCGALLLGDPLEALPAASAAAVSAWLAVGGSLLLVNSAPSRRFPGLLPPPLHGGLSLRRRRLSRGLPLEPLAAGAVSAPTTATLLVPEALRAEVAGLRPFWPWQAAQGWSRGWLARLLRRDREHTLALLPAGAGRLLYVGAPALLGGPPELLAWIAARWLRFADRDVARRMGRVQRHRLLHGYPMAPVMAEDVDDGELRALESQVTSPGRRTIVGVLPHPFCNPAVKGCGFCTFPHEDYKRPLAHELALAVAAEIERRAPASPIPVEAVYLGGGTANLTPPEDLLGLCRTLAARFDLRGAEVTLEGVPIYFLAKRPRPLDVLREALPGCAVRISMGVQTFDGAWLERMGRRAFGDAGTFAEVVAAARALDMGVSIDLLCNLPGQPLPAMLDDVERALALGVDQICLYHLVLDEDMSTEWAKDRSLLQQRPDNGAACANWLALRERLLRGGYVQRTLTNFERADAEERGRAFRYERLGFTPEEVDVLGFGPGGLTLRARTGGRTGLKTMNAGGAEDYLARAADGRLTARSLVFGRTDMKILWLTRRVALLGLDRAAYGRLFHGDLLADFGEELAACAGRGLCTITDARVDLTPAGMFYADTVAGLLAARRVEEMRLKRWLQRERPAYARRWRRSLDDAQDQALEAALSYDPNDARDHGMG